MRIASKSYIKSLLVNLIQQIAPFKFGIEEGKYGYYNRFNEFKPFGQSGDSSEPVAILTFKYIKHKPEVITNAFRTTALYNINASNTITISNTIQFATIQEEK